MTTDHDAVKRALVAARQGVAARRARRRADRPSGADVCETLLRAYAVEPRGAAHLGAGDRGRAVRAAGRQRARASAGADGTRITNLRHGSVDVPDDLGRRLITLLDGTRDRAALLRELDRPADELERSLEGLARIAVLER